MSLGDLFPDDFKNDFAKRNIDVGKALLIKIEDFVINYPKYIILVANNNDETVMAFVVINSEVNENIFPTPYLKSLHVSIDKAKHPFLDYDSYVNCSEVKEFNRDDIFEFLKQNPERAVGNVDSETLNLIKTTLSNATTIPPFIKRKFSL